jgi:glycoside/pentoside/hexuronide:cation symporter, GPH family
MAAPSRSAQSTLPRKTIARYAIGSIGTGGFSTLPGLVLVYYLTDTLGVAALLAGVLVTAAKIWDVIIDPVLGAQSDRSLAHTGSRRRFMVIGALTLPVFFVLTFAVPAGLDPVVSGVWVLLAFILTATSFSLFQVPYIALPAELTSSYDDRTRLLTWRVVVLTFAILLFGAGGPELRALGGGEHLGYLLMAVVAGLVIGAGMYVSSSVAPRGVDIAGPAPKVSIAENYRSGIRALQRSQPFRALLLTFVLQGLATGLMLAGAQYVATWVLDSERAVTLLFVALIAPALLAAPVWGLIARGIGKERTFMFASILFSLAALSLAGMLWEPGAWVYVPVAVAGAAYAGMQSLPMAMLPDVISHDARSAGEGKAGAFSGVWTAGETAGMALGATVLTIVLAITGYAESVAGVDIEQTPRAVAGIVLSFSVVPAAIIALSLVSLSRYGLRRAFIEQPVVEEAQDA